MRQAVAFEVDGAPSRWNSANSAKSRSTAILISSAFATPDVLCEGVETYGHILVEVHVDHLGRAEAERRTGKWRRSAANVEGIKNVLYQPKWNSPDEQQMKSVARERRTGFSAVRGCLSASIYRCAVVPRPGSSAADSWDTPGWPGRGWILHQALACSRNHYAPRGCCA